MSSDLCLAPPVSSAIDTPTPPAPCSPDRGATLTPLTDPDEWDGRWCYDEMVMQDEAPDPAPGLRNVTVSACGPWANKHLLFASDEEVSRLASSAAFKRELRKRGIEKEPQGSIELKGAVEVLIEQINKQEGRK